MSCLFLGNTCFLNSIVQVLRHTPGFQEQIQALAKEITITRKERSLLAEIRDEEEMPILTWDLTTGLRDVRHILLKKFIFCSYFLPILNHS